MQNIRLNGHEFIWFLTDRHEAFPDATSVLRITSDTLPLNVALAVKAPYGPPPKHSVWIGPTFVDEPGLPRACGDRDAGRYFLLPAFTLVQPGGIQGEVVRSIVSKLLAGKRLVRCNAAGIYWKPQPP